MAISTAVIARGGRIEGAARAEAALRRGVGWALLCLRFLGGLGLAWDEQWHARVGRDQFLTPPHLLLYASTALTGLLCLAFVLWESHRYRQHDGVHEGNTVCVLRIFHAPLGIVVAGFGALTTALAAPFDNYWHALYGIDVTLWAPFHVMGFIGGLLQTLGLLYYWASLLVAARRTDPEHADPYSHPEAWGVLLAVMFLLGGLLNLAGPAFTRVPRVVIGGTAIMLPPLLLAIAVPWTLIAAVGIVGRASAAPLMGLMLAAHEIVLRAIVPWAVRTGAAAEGLTLRARADAAVPGLGAAALALDLYIILMALFVALTWRAARIDRAALSHAARGAALGLALWGFVIGVRPGMMSALAASAVSSGLTPGVWEAFLHTLPLALGAGGLSGVLGGGLSEILRRSPR